jgi:hypothetical protein
MEILLVLWASNQSEGTMETKRKQEAFISEAFHPEVRQNDE